MAFINTETLSQNLKRVEFSVFEVKLQLYYLSDQLGQVLSRPRRFKSQFFNAGIRYSMVAGKSSVGIAIGIQHFNGQFAMFSVNVDLKPVSAKFKRFRNNCSRFLFCLKTDEPVKPQCGKPNPHDALRIIVTESFRHAAVEEPVAVVVGNQVGNVDTVLVETARWSAGNQGFGGIDPTHIPVNSIAAGCDVEVNNVFFVPGFQVSRRAAKVIIRQGIRRRR